MTPKTALAQLRRAVKMDVKPQHRETLFYEPSHTLKPEKSCVQIDVTITSVCVILLPYIGMSSELQGCETPSAFVTKLIISWKWYKKETPAGLKKTQTTAGYRRPLQTTAGQDGKL